MQQFSRHPGGLIFSIVFPIIQMSAFLYSIGHDVRAVHLGIVNEEVPIFNDCLNTSLITAAFDPEDYTCHYNKLSCRYIKSFDDGLFIKHFYDNLDDAMVAVRSGQIVGALHVPRNFSESIYKRVEEGDTKDSASIENSFLNYWLDTSNHQVTLFLKKKLYNDYEKFSIKLFSECNASESLGNSPISFKEPVYGTKNTTFTDFMAPGLMATVVFFLATTATCNLMIADKLSGVWDRLLVAGVESSEMLTVHIVIQTIIIIFQVVEVMLITFIIYGIPFHGDVVTVGVLLALQGLAGMCFGFFISITCKSYTLAFFVSTGSFYPMILLCGIVWPIEGMQQGLQLISKFLPFTIPIQSLRNAIEKGFYITEFRVIDGYLVSMTWITLLLSGCYIILKYEK